MGPEEIILPGQELSDSQKKEARSVWRKERLRSLEEDTEEAQQIAERITELSRYSGLNILAADIKEITYVLSSN